jgi:hypothetical protein
MLLLLFKGTGARRTLERVVGENLPPAAEWGRTIRGTYGDYALAQDGSVGAFHILSQLAPWEPVANHLCLVSGLSSGGAHTDH